MTEIGGCIRRDFIFNETGVFLLIFAGAMTAGSHENRRFEISVGEKTQKSIPDSE